MTVSAEPKSGCARIFNLTPFLKLIICCPLGLTHFSPQRPTPGPPESLEDNPEGPGHADDDVDGRGENDHDELEEDGSDDSGVDSDETEEIMEALRAAEAEHRRRVAVLEQVERRVITRERFLQFAKVGGVCVWVGGVWVCVEVKE